MNTRSLRVPNRHELRDSIMSNNSCFIKDEAFRQSYLRPRTLTCYSPQSKPARTPATDLVLAASEREAVAVDGLLSLITRKRKREPFNSCHLVESSLPRSPGNATTDTESVNSDKHDAVMLNWATTQIKSQQELTQKWQMNHKENQDNRTKDLELNVRQLSGEIEKLEKRRRLSAAQSDRESVWNVVSDYFSLFRFGLQLTNWTQISTQVNFLRTWMAPNATFNAGRGSEVMIRSWKWLSLWFQDVEMVLEDLGTDAGGALVAFTTTSFTFTERTLRNVFPHLASGYNTIADKLLDQRIVMRGSTRFEWDHEQRRLGSVMAQSDLLTPMLGLLGNLEDVGQVFEKSIISPDLQWRSTA